MRNRCLGLRESWVATAALLLVLSACSGDEESVETSSATSSTMAAATTTTSSPLPESRAPATTTTTDAPSPAFAGIGETVLVTADDGVYQIGPEGDVARLVAGPIAYAVDDTQGGLLFQVDRGRNWDEETQWSTIVWWIPRGASRPQELLVPTPGANHRLSLHDAYATDEGFAVLYTRHEGSPPDVDDMIDRLRRFDIASAESFAAPPARTEPAPFWTVMLASLDNASMDYDAAQLVAGNVAAQHAVDTGVLWSDGFVTLNPGYWAVFAGHFATRDEALAHCESLEADCYARYVAAASVTGITLRADGLGIASFGDPVESVLDTLTSVLGPPDSQDFVDPVAEQTAMPNGYAANRYFRLASWESPGLHVVFSDSNYYREDGEPHFVGWGVRRSGLKTAEGIGVGSPVADLVGAYGDRVALPDSFLPECGGGWTFRVEPPDLPETSDYYASMHGDLDEDPRDPLSRVTRLHGGATSSC